MTEVYLDYNATTPLDPSVLEAMTPYFGDHFANASSVHRKGQKSRDAVEYAREQVADVLGVEPGDLVFTSGGTEADNLALKGVLEWKSRERRHLVVSSIEHHAVLYPARYLESHGFELSIVPALADGRIDLQALSEAVSERTALVSIMHANNETGVLQPIEEVGRIAHRAGAYFHTDAVQTFGKIPVRPEELGIDLLSASSHKICGPKGAGVLYIRKGLKIKPQSHGGHQEKNIRPGTENVASIVGFGKAARLTQELGEKESIRVRALRDRLEEGILQKVRGVRRNGDADERLYQTSNLSFDGLDGETLLVNLDLNGIFVSTGSACTAGSVEPSHVLLAMGIGEKQARSSIRFSLGRFTTPAEIDRVLTILPELIQKQRKAST